MDQKRKMKDNQYIPVQTPGFSIFHSSFSIGTADWVWDLFWEAWRVDYRLNNGKR